MTTAVATDQDFPAILERGFFQSYGLKVSPVGEDGEAVLLGHPDRRRAVAAFNQMHRNYLSLANAFDDRSASYTDALGRLDYTHAVIVAKCLNECQSDQGEQCANCEEIKRAEWWLQWHVDKDTPGAFPVVIWMA